MSQSKTNIDSIRTANADLAKSVYNVTGKGITVLIEEGGKIRDTHQELQGRVTLHSSISHTGYDDHATHVAGTIGATGVLSNAIGFAPECNLLSYMFGTLPVTPNEFAKETDNIHISNHSYTYIHGYKHVNHPDDTGAYRVFTCMADWNYFRTSYDPNRELSEFAYLGKYNNITRNIDQVITNAPTVLCVWSAGNDNEVTAFEPLGEVTIGGETFLDPICLYETVQKENLRSTHVVNGKREFYENGVTYVIPAGNWGPEDYDLLSYPQVSKNVLTVGSIMDVTEHPIAQDPETYISNFSSRGPTDDGRVKPDLVANGETLLSCAANSDNGYTTYSGTSMAAPSVAGSAALIYEHYRNVVADAAYRVDSGTLKAVMLANAFRNEKPPNYFTGYGIVDVNASLEFLSNWGNANFDNENYVYLGEHTYSGDGAVDAIEVYPKNLEEKVSLMMTWVDHTDGTSAYPSIYQIDAEDSVIQNKLLVSCEDADGNVYYPWYLNVKEPSLAARNEVHAGENDDTYGIVAPHDNVKLIEFVPTSLGKHTIKIMTTDVNVKPDNATGQKYTVLAKNVRTGTEPISVAEPIADDGASAVVEDDGGNGLMSVAAPSSAAYKLWSHPAHNDISYVFEKKGTETFDLNSLSNANSSKFFFTVHGRRGESGKATGVDFSANYFPHTYTPKKIEYLKKETSLIADSSFGISSTIKDISFSMTTQTGAATASTKFRVQSVANGQRHLHTQADACLNINSFVFYNLFDTNGRFYQKLNISAAASFKYLRFDSLDEVWFEKIGIYKDKATAIADTNGTDATVGNNIMYDLTSITLTAPWSLAGALSGANNLARFRNFMLGTNWLLHSDYPKGYLNCGKAALVTAPGTRKWVTLGFSKEHNIKGKYMRMGQAARISHSNKQSDRFYWQYSSDGSKWEDLYMKWSTNKYMDSHFAFQNSDYAYPLDVFEMVIKK